MYDLREFFAGHGGFSIASGVSRDTGGVKGGECGLTSTDDRPQKVGFWLKSFVRVAFLCSLYTVVDSVASSFIRTAREQPVTRRSQYE